MAVDEQANEGQKEEEPYGLGCALDYFTEHEEIFQLIDNLKIVAESEKPFAEEKPFERFSFILNQYIEQPHLIDSYLDQMLEKLISIVRSTENTMKHKHLAFMHMFVIVNVRGYKVIVRHLPHEVADFEPVLQLLESQDPNDANTWTTRYILLLWLSIIVMIPFHMSRFDGFDEKDTERISVMDRVLTMIKTYAIVNDKCRDAAPYLAHKFITRSDVKEKHLSSFLDWAKRLSTDKDSTLFVREGTLACVATILKHGKREDMLPYASQLLIWIVNADFKNNCGTNIEKLVYKIIQRIGLIFLPPRLASWRYKRGNRSLAANLSSGDSGTVANTSTNHHEETECDEDIEVPDEIEEVIDQLIQGLRSSDGIVRWSAAKGIGRVTGRLPKDLGDEVVGTILELFSPRESDGAWHGGCLALAELGRRGLLLPDRLPQVVPVVLKALVYDEPRGYSSVGSHIRDAACYVCWSFSRAYESHVLAAHVKDIASALLVVTCFDKEVNCRRAASAAFQENVGRQGNFPHGIDILTTADFFSVSVRANAYLNISVYVAQFEEYKIALIQHLLNRKVDHWDTAIRELTAKAMHNLTATAPDYMIETALPILFEKTTSIDLNCRHGATMSIGEVIHALSKLNYLKKMPEALLDKTRSLIPWYRERMYFRGLGGELMKHACSDFIEKCSLAAVPFHNQSVVEDWLKLLNECLSYDVANIRMAAIKALPSLLNEYYSDKSERCNELVKDYAKELKATTVQAHRMGHCLALGALPKFILVSNFDFIVTSLIEATAIVPATVKWAESRRDAVKALTSIANTMSEHLGNEFTQEHALKMYDTFLEGLKDYTQDKRGDIGAWMREASVLGLQTLTLLATEKMAALLTVDLMNKVVPNVAQQAVEKIDRTRALAGKVFYSFVYNEPTIPNLPHHAEVSSIFVKEECDDLNWNSGSATFPKFVQLVYLPCYTYNVMLGLICSIGGLTNSLVKHSSSSFFTSLKAELESRGNEELHRISDVILKIFMDHQKVDRITIPMFKFLDKLFDAGCLEPIIQNDRSGFIKKILKLVQKEIAGCKDTYKLLDGISVLCQFIQVKGDVCATALVQLMILLCHRQSYVRRSTSAKLYESLLVNGDSGNVDPAKLDQAMNVLSSTNWEEPLDQIRPIRNQLCDLLDVKVPVPAKKATQLG
ncbi:unnamed protein product [Callosobruchus maculatus]|uniref:Tubulin-specific chaperone D n=1 Tax=Callosobruchus maculatus TaxID=64391 RepID=A0A653CU36_CALMS|nr:unnamed protein product [Callosobruchus maculatus]